MNLNQIKHVLRSLSLSQLKRLDQWLHEMIRRTEASSRAAQPLSGKQAVVGQTLNNKTYRQESIRCGKENCKCARGKLHGPYWYSYTRVKNKIKSQYIGKLYRKRLLRNLISESGKIH